MTSGAWYRSSHLSNYAGHVVLENDQGRAVISPAAGASLRSLAAKIKGNVYELLAGGDAPDLNTAALAHGTGSFIMAPWPNRIPGGVLVAPDGKHTLSMNDRLHTIHGLVRDKVWEVESRSTESARLEIDLPEPWPYRGKVIYEVRLDGASLSQTLIVESHEETFPAGVGWHPWFRNSIVNGGVSLQLDALEAWVLDEEMTPSGETSRPPILDAISRGAMLEAGTTDECFRIKPGAKATLTWPELSVEILSSETVDHVMVYAPPDGSALCVEPQTTCVNAFQLHARGVQDTGTRFAIPGQPLAATTVWSWR